MHQRQQKKRKEIKKYIHKTRKKKRKRKLNHEYIAKAETTQKQGS